MALRIPVSKLSDIYGALAEALPQLERLGEVVAAAHLAAALDAVEASLGKAALEERAEQGGYSVISYLAGRMREKFGDRAEGVARRQLTGAIGPTLIVWAAIVNEIGA